MFTVMFTKLISCFVNMHEVKCKSIFGKSRSILRKYRRIFVRWLVLRLNLCWYRYLTNHLGWITYPFTSSIIYFHKLTLHQRNIPCRGLRAMLIEKPQMEEHMLSCLMFAAAESRLFCLIGLSLRENTCPSFFKGF